MLSLRDEYTQNFSLSRTFFHVLGVYPLPDVSTKWRFLTDIWFWIAYVNLAVCALVELITIVIGFATDSSNFVDNVAIVPLLSYTVISLEQILSVYRKRDRYIVFLVALRDLFEKHSKEDLRRNNYENYQRRGRNERVSYAISYIALIMTFNFISVGRSIVTYFKDGHWFLELPYAVWYPFNTREDGVFMLVYLQQLWWGFTCIMGVLAINLLLATVTDHICFEFYVLGGKFKALNLKDVQCRSLIRDLVGHHNILIGLTQELASLISFSLLMNFMLITVVMCTVGFQIIATDSLSESLKFLLFLLVCLLQTLSLSYFGNRIMDASISVGDRVYESDWLDGDLMSKKYLLFVILRSRRPVCLRAESFSIVSLKSFGAILSTSYSYFTILRQVFYGKTEADSSLGISL